MTDETITVPDIDEAAFARLDNLIPVADLRIENHDGLEAAADNLKALVAAKRDLESRRLEAVGPLNNAVKKINDAFRGPMQRCKDAENTIKRAIAAYQARVERERREREDKARREREAEQARLRAEAERAEAAERERARVAREKAEAAARKAEADGRAERAESLRRQAELAEQERLRVAAAAAESMRQQADMKPAGVVEAPASKLAGVSGRKIWKFRITDLRALPDKYLTADEVKIGKVVRALGDECDIPGIEVYEESTVSVRT